MKRYLILEDGTTFSGEAVGISTNITGELVVFRSFLGYQQALTSHTLTGNIVVLTNPEIGNVGINRDDFEAINPTIRGVVMAEANSVTSHFQSQQSLDSYLKAQHISGLKNVDVRGLSRHLAKYGPMKASFMDTTDAHAHEQIKALVITNNQVNLISTKQPYSSPNIGPNIVVLDLGVQNSLLRELSRRKANVTVLPYDVDAQVIKALDPDGIVISDGPGKSSALVQTTHLIQAIQPDYPILALGLGFSVAAQANGVTPVYDGDRALLSNLGVIEKLSNHTDFVTRMSLNRLTQHLTDSDLLPTHFNADTGEILGYRHYRYPLMAFNFSPDSVLGPWDSNHVFDDFFDLIESELAKRG